MNQFIQLFLMALTVAMEAGGQSYQGKLGVAWVLHRRQMAYRSSLSDVEFKAYQFSAWLTGSATLMNLDQVDDATFFACLKACIAAVYELEADPTHGATHYLNVNATKAQRPNHDLPEWAADPYDKTKVNEAKVTARIQDHTFLKAA